MELQSGMAAAITIRMGDFPGRFSTSMRLVVTGHRDFAALEQCGLPIGKKKVLLARRWRCDGVAGIGSALAMDWRPAVDEVLLMSSVLLAYVAGVVKPFGGISGKNTTELPSSTKSFAEDHLPRRDRSTTTNEVVWDGINRKLVDAISRAEGGAAISDSPATLASSPKLCLQALAYGPRIRLLLAALSLLRNEASSRDTITIDELCCMVGPVCRLWISQESGKKDANLAGCLSSSMIETGDLTGGVENEAKEYLSTRLRRSGKAQLFVDVLRHLCKKKPSSSGTSGDRDMSREFVANVLEDVAIAVSDGAAAMYLAAVGVAHTSWSTLLQPSICSTRSLERFRNEVALQQWIHYNFDSVAATYEDRVEIWGLTADKRQIEEPDSSSRSRKNNQKPQGVEILRLDRRSIRMRRGRELKALAGWRYCYSLYLEFSDVVGPLLRVLVTKAGQGLSFLLVCLIGRSFGLIYQGIRQSMKWSSSDR